MLYIYYMRNNHAKPDCQFPYLLIACLFSLMITMPALSQLPGSVSGGDIWSQGTDMPTSRSSHFVGAVNGKIYAIGGHAEHGVVPTVEEYDPETDTWTRKANMGTGRWGLAATAVNGRIYAMEGANAYPPTKSIKTVEEYNPVTNTWTIKSSMPAGRNRLANCSVNGKIYVPGGGGLKQVTHMQNSIFMIPGVNH